VTNVSRRQERTGVLLIAGAALLWSTAGVGIKALDDPPLKVVFFRCAIACLITFVTATKWTTAANAIFLQYSGVIWVLLLSPFVLKEPLKARDVAAIGIAFVGITLLFLGKFDPRGRAGDAVALSSGLFFAGLTLTLRRERGVGAEAIVTWGSVLTAAVVFPFVARDLSLTPTSALAYLLLGLFQLAGAYVLFVRGVRFVTATEASLVGMLEPIANPLWVLIFLGEKPPVTSVLGGIIVLGAIAWRTLTGPAPPPVAPPD
jgi:drug/metabolite transporter, DME family